MVGLSHQQKVHPIVAQLERAAGFASLTKPRTARQVEALLAQSAEQLDEASPLFGALLSVSR